SGLKSVHLAAQAIMLEDAEVIVAGGMENMSQAPYLSKEVRNGMRMGDKTFIDSMIHDGLWCAMNDYHMGITAENICDQYQLSREVQDDFAAKSQKKAAQAIEKGKSKDEIVSVEVTESRDKTFLFEKDEYVRPGTTNEALGKLRPASKKDGSVTAGNASGINDGAAEVVLMSRKKAKELAIKPLATLVGSTSVGLDLKVMGLGLIESTKKDLADTNLTISDLDLVDANDAIATKS